MNSNLLALVQKYKHKGLFIDTNIALLYLVGTFDLALIRNHSRTAMYSEDDFEKVSRFVEFFGERITTPHVLTEISNLLGKGTDVQAVLIEYIKRSKEIYLGSSDLSRSAGFFSYGLTDSAIFETARSNYLVVTDDGPLYSFLLGSKVDAVNLSQIRMI